ncbi:MAG: hypothetical protein JXR83_05705 [Deltaproteobacteria bacterium]|nr:hypothetical protein [Deltaproteobacteria bacterium]
MRATSAILAAVGALAISLAAAGEEKKGRGVDYDIDVSASTRQLKVGERGKIVIAIVPSADRKVHKQAPISIDLRAPAGIVLDKAKLGRSDITKDSEKRLELSVGFVAKSGGEQSVEANATFFICTDKWCQRMTERIVIPVHVQ